MSEFETWMKSLRSWVSATAPDLFDDDYLNPQNWRAYFDDGYAPEAAFYEDQSYD